VFGEAYARDDSSNKRFVRIEQDGKLTIMEWLEVWWKQNL
jgi:hypothetical protein